MIVIARHSFKFQKRGQLFLYTDDETASIAAVCVRCFRENPKHESHPLGSTLGSLRSRLPLSANEAVSSYGLFGPGLYPAWIASCSVMYLPFLVVP